MGTTFNFESRAARGLFSRWPGGAAIRLSLLLSGLVAATFLAAPWSRGQQPAAPASPAAAAETLEDPAAPSGGDPTVAATDASTASSAPAGTGPRRRRTALDSVIDSGIIGAVIILLSMVATGFVVEHSLSMRKSVLMPEQVLNDLEALIAEGQVDQAIEYCQQPQNHSVATNCVLAGLERFKGSEFGFAEYKSAVEEEGEDQMGRLYRKTEALGLIGVIAPMLGLLGTVQGMIISFDTIAMKGGMARPDELAGSISLALVTTFEGLVVAIPAMIAFSFFRNKIDSVVAEAGKRIERIMTPLGRQK